MRSGRHGRNTSTVEVTSISADGFLIVLSGEVLFVPYSGFPWFRDATISAVKNVECPAPDHLYWPELDIDLSVESLRHPDKFPLVSSAGR